MSVMCCASGGHSPEAVSSGMAGLEAAPSCAPPWAATGSPTGGLEGCSHSRMIAESLSSQLSPPHSFCLSSSQSPCVQRKSCLPSVPLRGWDAGFGRRHLQADSSPWGLPPQVAGGIFSPKHCCINPSKLWHSLTLPDTGRVRIGRGRARKKMKEGGMSHQSRQIASKTLKLS